MKSRLAIALSTVVIAITAYADDGDGTATVDVSGTWSLAVETDLGSGSPTVTISQDGQELMGEYEGMFGTLPLTGTINGNEVTFSFVTNATGQDETIAYKGTVEGSSLKGELQLGTQGSGTFVGRRIDAGPASPPSGRSLSDILTPEIRAVAPAEVATLLQEVDVRRDIVFAQTPEKELLLDVYAPKESSSDALPCVVWIHGGGLNALTKDYDLIRWCAAYTARAGFVSMSIDYRLRPEAELPAAIVDAKTALRFVRANATEFGIDPDRIAVAGESAGGYLAAFVAFAAGESEFNSSVEAETSDAVACAVVWYTPLWTDLGFSPGEHLSSDDPPALFVHGDQDSLVKLVDSKSYVERLNDVGAEAELLVIEGAEHGFFDVNSNVEAYKMHMTEALDATVAFLKKHLE